MTFHFRSSWLAVPEFVVSRVTNLQRSPWRVVAVLLIFAGVYWQWGFAEALLAGLVALAVVARLGGRIFLGWALLVIFVLPVFYLLDRPAQAERVGVLAFCLLALGIVVNAIEVWRSRSPHVPH